MFEKGQAYNWNLFDNFNSFKGLKQSSQSVQFLLKKQQTDAYQEE